MIRWIVGIASSLAVAAFAGPASAQQPSAAPPGSSQGPIVVEEVHDGLAIAPEVKVTDVNRSTGVLVGAYGGWMIDNTILIGGGGYGLTNGSGRTGMGYGGLVVAWLQHTDRPIGFGARSLIGFGEATTTGTVVASYPPFPAPYRDHVVHPTPVQATFHEHFFVFEPQADVLFRLSGKLRLDAGVGYRIIDGAHGVDSDLHGVVGSVSLQIGGSTYIRR